MGFRDTVKKVAATRDSFIDKTTRIPPDTDIYRSKEGPVRDMCPYCQEPFKGDNIQNRIKNHIRDNHPMRPR